jgi:hypothetical protein
MRKTRGEEQQDEVLQRVAMSRCPHKQSAGKEKNGWKIAREIRVSKYETTRGLMGTHALRATTASG